MKKLKPFSILIVLPFIVLYTCTKDIDVQFSFDFNLNETYDDIATINYQEPVLIKIVPLRIISGNTYKFSYQINSGTGYLVNGLGESLEESVVYTAESLDINLNFIGTELGETSLTVTVTDQDSRIKSTTLIFEVIHNPFIWDANSTISNVTLNETTPLNLILDNTGEDASVTYESKFYFVQGEGTIYKTDTNGASTTEVEQNEFTPINEAIHSYNIDFTQTGINKVYFEAKDSNGQTKIDSLLYTVSEIDFQYIGAAQQNTLFVGELTNLNFEINEIDGSGEVYESRLEFNSGNAVIKRTYNGVEESINPGVYYPVNVGSYIWEIEATALGTIDMTYYAKNSTGTEHEIPITIEVPEGAFTFQAIASQNTTQTNVPVTINYNIVETTGTGSPYQMVYTTSIAGTISYNGTVYAQGEIIPIVAGASVGVFTPLESGEANIEFTTTSNEALSLSDDVNITVNTTIIDFSLSTVGDGDLYINTLKDFFAIITQDQTDASITYQVRFNIVSGSTGSGELYKEGNLINLGTYEPTDIGNTNYQFKGTLLGDVNVLVEVLGSNGTYQSSTLDFTVDSISYSFSATEQDGSITLGESTDVFFNISETANSGANYDIKYIITSSETGEFVNAGTVVNPNTPTPISVGASSWTFNSVEPGTITITFIVKNLTTLEEKDDSINIIVQPQTIPDFSFTAIPVTNSDFVNECIAINFDITEFVAPSAPYKMVFTTSLAGTFEFNGTVYQQGELIDLSSLGNATTFSGCYMGTVNASHNVEFTLTNNNIPPISHSSQVDIVFNNYDFNFNVTSENNALLGDAVAQDFTYTEDLSFTQNLTFFSSESGTFSYNGNTYNEGDIIPINPTDLLNGAWAGTYSANNEGTHNITYTLTASNGVSKTKDIVIVFEPNCTISTNDFGEWFKSGVNVNDTYTWTNTSRQVVTSTFEFTSSCNNDVTITYSIVSQSSPILPLTGAKYKINTNISGASTVLPINTSVVLPPNLPHRLDIDTNGNGNSGTRVVKFTLTNGVDTEEIIFTQVFN